MNTKTILITGARSFVALDLSRTFHLAGYRVICADSIKNGPCRFSKCVSRYYKIASAAFSFEQFVKDLNSIIEKEKVDFLIPTCEEIFYISKAKTRIQTTVFAEDFEILEILHNKWKFYQLLCKLSLPTPETHLLNRTTNRKGKWIRKNIYSRFAAPIREDENNQIIEQAFIQGKKLCSYSICQNGKVVAHAVYETLHSIGIGSAICFKTVHDPEVDQFVLSIVSQLNFTGQIAFDFIKERKLYCLECNPRATSGVHVFQRDLRLSRSFFESQQSILKPKIGNIFHEHLFMFWYGIKQKEIFSKNFWQNFFQGKNPLWCKGDNRVITRMPLMLMEVFKMTLLKGKSFHEALTEGIEYNGDLL